jgi:hypothetical protein
VVLAVQALLGGEELWIRQVLQVVDDRDAWHAWAPEARDGERAKEHIGLE